MHLPQGILSSVFQHLDESEVKMCEDVSQNWRSASSSSQYYSLIASRDGLTGKGDGISAEEYYRQFEKQPGSISGEERWVIRYDVTTKTWLVDEDLVGLVQSKNQVAVVSACTPSKTSEGLQQTTKLLSSLMRCKPLSTFSTPSDEELEIGIKCWSLPSTVRTGVSSLFMMGVTVVPDKFKSQLTILRDSTNTDDEDEAVNRSNPEYVECSKVFQILHTISSHVFVVDDSHCERPWWSVFPSGYTPLYLRDETAVPVPVDNSKLTIVSEDDLFIPSSFEDAADRKRVSTWLYHFQELCFLKIDTFSDPQWSSQIASECQLFKTVQPIHLGHTWKDISMMVVKASNIFKLAELAAEMLNENSTLDLFGNLFADKLTIAIMTSHVQTETEFYNAAMLVELENGPVLVANKAELGEAAEAPAATPAPLWSTQLVEAHEQHLFSACRRLIYTMCNAAVPIPIAVKVFEQLKHQVSCAFRDAWTINQKRSKLFCVATFNSVFETLTAKYTQPDPKAGQESGDESIEKTNVRLLKKFYQQFTDHLEEYQMKAIGTRLGDVMLDRAKDLLERIESVNVMKFHREDLHTVVETICTDVAQRVLKETRKMEASRSSMQKTCALYTVLLGMECRQKVSEQAKESWLTAVDKGLLEREQIRRDMYSSLMGVDPTTVETLENASLTHIDSLVEGLTKAISDTDCFLSQLPSSELAKNRFGVIVASKDTRTTRRKLLKVKSLFGKVKEKVTPN